MKLIHVALRGLDKRGPFNIQTNVEAGDLLLAVEQVMEAWGIVAPTLTRLHAQPADEGRPVEEVHR